MTRRASDPAVSLAEKVRLRRMLDRVWAPFLTPAEAKVVTFIFTTTVEWSKPCDRLKVSHFVEGFANGGGTGLSDKTVRRALDTLERDGAIRRKRTPYGYVIALIWEWIPASVRAPRGRAAVPRKVLSARAPAIPVALSKSREIGQNDRERSVKMADVYREEHTREVIPNNRPPDSDDPVSLKRDRPGKEKKEPYVDPLDLTNLHATWTAAIAETFPDIAAPAWGRREEAQACQFVNLDDKTKRASALDVFAWSIRSWRQIMAARFAWMTIKAPPTYPNVGFMVRWRDALYDAWNDQERLRSEITLNTHDRRVKRMMHQGASYEEAHKEAEARDALAAERIKLAQKSAKLDDMMRRSEQLRTPTLQQRLAALAEPKQPRPPTRGPVFAGIEGSETAFDRTPSIFGAF